MLILHATGQTCNKFFIYRNYLADSIESGEKIIILSPDITTRDYPNLQSCELLSFPFFSIKLANLIGYVRYIKLLKGLLGTQFSLLLLSLFFKIIPIAKFVKTSPGLYKSPNRSKHETTIQELFSPSVKIREEVSGVINKYRIKSNIIIGVHIRYGDYRTWLDGKYYYPPKQYHSLMLQIQNLFKDDSVVFFVASNEKIDLSEFSGCDCFSLPNGTSTKDLYGLSICDFLIGPPSTFSGWASYHGNVPVYFIEDPLKEVELSSFKYISEIWG